MIFCMANMQSEKEKKEKKEREEKKNNFWSNHVESTHTRHLKRKRMPRQIK
jgi:hypothetical protein